MLKVKSVCVIFSLLLFSNREMLLYMIRNSAFILICCCNGLLERHNQVPLETRR